MNLLNILTVENQKNKEIYLLIDYFFEFLKDESNEWLKNFVFWELNLFKLIGYDINFKNYVKKKIVDGEEKFVVESSKKIIPNFLINKDTNPHDHNEILKSFNIVGDFLDKSILKPNNLNYPNSRYEFLNLSMDSGVLTLTVDKPKSLNALNNKLLMELDDCLSSLRQQRDPLLKGMIFTYPSWASDIKAMV